MGWTVIKGNSYEKTEITLNGEFILSNTDIIYHEQFRVLKYLDPFGDTTFNIHMIEDLLLDLADLKLYLKTDKNRIEELIELAKSCLEEPHTFLKFYGD